MHDFRRWLNILREGHPDMENETVEYIAAHKLGNVIFALETNLRALQRRLPAEAQPIAAEMQASIEQAKVIIDELKTAANPPA